MGSAGYHYTLTHGFPPILGVRWFNVFVLTTTPVLGLYGLVYIERRPETICFSLIYYIFSMLGITAGYHRLWSHRAYNASYALQLFLLAGGTSAAQGSAQWWCRSHRSHHRYTDTEQDPYDSNRGLLWTHVGWMLFKTDLHAGPSDVSDLKKDALLRMQHRHYFGLMIAFAFLLPVAVCGIAWGDWMGGLCLASALRLTVAHHSTFCINSVAHFLGATPYDDRLSPRDHFLSAILTMGEGYHNFHHQFPMDYRNAIKWYQYDPTKWFISLCGLLRLASHLKMFSKNEIAKGAFNMELKRLKRVQDSVAWPTSQEELPVLTWQEFQKASVTSNLILVGGFIHDATSFQHEHPGGYTLIAKSSGLDMTSAFFGGVYRHSNAAHNLLSMMRIGVLHGGVEQPPPPHLVSPPQNLYISTREAVP